MSNNRYCDCGRESYEPGGKADRSRMCKECRYEYGRQWREANRDRLTAGKADWARENRARIRERIAIKRSMSPEWAERKRERDRARRADPVNRIRAREIAASRKYGISRSHAAQLYSAKACGICLKAPDSTMHIDHDHSTGRVRGALCGRCNVALGYVENNRKNIASMLAWLNRGGNGPE